ncbi:MAG: M24 family metallopeptidase [Acidobacteria bacterium]|nr:M24 family metallopeptidase [Acidobacteriota bacterium]
MTISNQAELEGTEELVPGMVLAVEPMISAGADVTRTDRDGWTVRTVDGSFTAHFENTILITEGPPRVLTRA